ncbi:MAG: glutamyl-tRNA reductase [Lachnospiraceae bacterium]|nr:glutamyl-tRNA reductase [Lachnospiraceae bacterium]
MIIKMAGIDHKKASVDVRERFSFTKKEAAETLQLLKKDEHLSGVILLSTCNRLELWCSYKDEDGAHDPMELICWLKQVDPEKAAPYFITRSAHEAVAHLFHLTGGMESLIPGDDQILTQVKDALSLSREIDCLDSQLEVLFRMAITTGKQVRTEIIFDKNNHSAPTAMVETLKARGEILEGKKALVVGNGEMGKLAAEKLVKEGVDVTVTVREYRSGIVLIPEGCHRINYGDRYRLIPACDYVISATASPNLTIKKEDLAALGMKTAVTFIDLAVPRDIDPAIAEVSGAVLYDIDSLKIGRSSDRMKEQAEAAEVIIAAGIGEYENMMTGRAMLPLIEKLGKAAGADAVWRISREMKDLIPDDEAREEMATVMAGSVDKVVRKMLFELRNELEPLSFVACMKALEPLAGEGRRK